MFEMLIYRMINPLIEYLALLGMGLLETAIIKYSHTSLSRLYAEYQLKHSNKETNNDE